MARNNGGKKSKKWHGTWWGIILIVFGSLIVLSIIIGATKDKNKFSCNPTSANLSCPTLDCSTCPVKTETKIETKIITDKMFVCPNLTEVKNKEDCIDFDKNGWYEVATIKANSSIASEPFIITSDIWRYTWSCKPTATAYDASIVSLTFCNINAVDCSLYNNDKSSISLNSCVNGDTSYVYNGKGTYYVDISGANFKNLEIKIEAKK